MITWFTRFNINLVLHDLGTTPPLTIVLFYGKGSKPSLPSRPFLDTSTQRRTRCNDDWSDPECIGYRWANSCCMEILNYAIATGGNGYIARNEKYSVGVNYSKSHLQRER